MNAWAKILRAASEYETQKQVDALRIRKSTGRTPSILAEDRPKLVDLIKKGAEASGFVGDVWTAPRVQNAASRELGIRVGVTTIKKFLHAEGFSVQKPTVKATQQDEAAVARFRIKCVAIDRANWTETKKGQSKSRQP